MLGIAYVIETYGLIYNKALLNDYFDADWSTVKSIDDLNNFEALKTVAEEIQAHKDDLHIRRYGFFLRLEIQDPSCKSSDLL